MAKVLRHDINRYNGSVIDRTIAVFPRN